MELDRVWGTDLEIHAAAALWQVKVCVCVCVCVRVRACQILPSHHTHGCALILCHHHAQLTISVECQELPCPTWIQPTPPIPNIPDVYVSLC